MIQIVTDIHSNRLVYVLDFVFNQILKTGYTICNTNEITSSKPIIYYGSHLDTNQKITFRPLDIIKESNQIDTQNIEIVSNIVRPWLDGIWNSASMDPFGVIFCFLSRYEEYLERKNGDKWNRFLAVDSKLHQLSPDEPIVDMMVLWIKSQLLDAYPGYIFPETNGYHVISTIDIDQAWAFKNKGWRNMLTLSKSMIKFDLGRTSNQLAVVSGRMKDPFDTYNYLDQLHKKLDLIPIFFILMSERRTSIDRNHKPSNPRFRQLLQDLSETNSVGVHPSYRSRKDDRILSQEINLLADITGKVVTASRQHFLIMQLPTTYRRLLSAGITDDYTMGFADRIGYRAGTGHSFYWYDIENETATPLKIHPFVMMDATLRRYMKLNVKQAVEKVVEFKKIARKYEVPLTVLWHNSSLGEDGEWKGWRQVYEIILSH